MNSFPSTFIPRNIREFQSYYDKVQLKQLRKNIYIDILSAFNEDHGIYYLDVTKYSVSSVNQVVEELEWLGWNVNVQRMNTLLVVNLPNSDKNLLHD
jgi:hypothetical protein